MRGKTGRRTGGRDGQRWLWFKVSPVTLLPGAVTASAQLSAGPSHLPENTPMHSCPSCGSPPLLGSSPLPAYYHALRPLLLAPTLTLSLTCLGLGVIIGPLPGGGKESRKKKRGGGWRGGGLSGKQLLSYPLFRFQGLSFDSDCRHSVKH